MRPVSRIAICGATSMMMGVFENGEVFSDKGN